MPRCSSSGHHLNMAEQVPSALARTLTVTSHCRCPCAVGEVVFNTSLTGYQEILTDPSYKGEATH